MACRIIFALTAAFSLAVAGVAAANTSVSGLDDGVRAYRAGEFDAAWRLLAAEAEKGAPAAKRYLGYIILAGETPEGTRTDLYKGVALLREAALAGDYVALVRLEELRRRRLAHSPGLEDIIAIETALGESGDPVAAWRLAKRFELGDGVEASEAGMAKWLEVAASTDPARFPKAGEAAYRLCELHAKERDARAARRWCVVAAEKGHMGAALILRRLAQLQG